MVHQWATAESVCIWCGVVKTPELETAECPKHPRTVTPRATPASIFLDESSIGARMRQIMEEERKWFSTSSAALS